MLGEPAVRARPEGEDTRELRRPYSCGRAGPPRARSCPASSRRQDKAPSASTCASGASSSPRSGRSRRPQAVGGCCKKKARQRQGPVRLHAPVRDHDQRRPAAGAVPRRPRRQQATSRTFGRVIAEVTRDVEGGSTLAEALGKHTERLRRPVPQHDRGRRGGRYPRRRSSCAWRIYIEKADALQRKVKGAMTYPAIVLTVAVRRRDLHAHLRHPDLRQDVHGLRRRAAAPTRDRHGHVELPAQLLVGAGRRPSSALIVALQALPRHRQRAAATSTGCCCGCRSSATCCCKGAVARFTRTLGTLIGSGVPILQGLEITARTAATGDRRRPSRPRASASARARPSPQPLQERRRLPADGGADDRRRRADRRPRRDADQDRRLLRRRGRRGGRRPDVGHRADHDRASWAAWSAACSSPCTCRCSS